MAFEKRWRPVPLISFTANGGSLGQVTVGSTLGFYVKQEINIQAAGLPTLRLEIKKIFTDNDMVVGPKGSISNTQDLSLYTTGLSASIFAFEQPRNSIDAKDYARACYEEEPTVAWRTIWVDRLGNPYSEGNPVPIAFDGTIAVGNVTIQDDDGDELEINPDGSININIQSANTEAIDTLNIPLVATEVSYTFPDKTKFYQIRCRDDKDIVRLGLNAGDIASGIYWTINRGAHHDSREVVHYPNSYTIYFESKHKTNVDLEIHYWYVV